MTELYHKLRTLVAGDRLFAGFMAVMVLYLFFLVFMWLKIAW
ncbi:MAG: hypothetical protein A4E59_00377 [Syntrophorhabdus sp. PtaB.Bin027]|nr:MAG: hypothetical protein A4E59_00377 [Syntrophorhabdus sp. PtaB.Bin027]